MVVFPVKGSNRFTDDFAMSRSGGRKHNGIDIFAKKGTPVVAVDSGLLKFQQNDLGGNAATLTTSDGTRYYYAHLDSYEGESPRTVFPGMVIGYVGNTGNATHTDSHLHFQVMPQGGEPVNPFNELTALKTGKPAIVTEVSAPTLTLGKLVVGGILLGGAFLLIRHR